MVISGGRFERNVSTGSAGGGLFGIGTISGTLFISNSANAGGGFYGSGTIINARFEGNQSTMEDAWLGSGGAVATFGIGSTTISQTRFINNFSATRGGAVSAGGPDQLTIINSLFARNTAREGTAVSDNPYAGGSGHISLLHVTIASTQLNPASAVSILSSTAQLTNTIITNHTIGISNTGGTVTEDYNLFYGNVTNTIGVMTGAYSLIGDPRFVDPAHDDYHLQPDSPAIDAGSDVGVYTDLDGNPRPFGNGFDLGAYESPYTMYADLAISTSVAPSLVAPGQSLTYTLTFSNQGPHLARGVLITDSVPTDLIDLAVTYSGAAITPTADYTYTWQVADLAPNDGGVITISGVISAPWFTSSSFTNTASIAASTVDTDTTDNEASVSVSVCGTIQCMIDAAHDGDTIIIPAGTYTESLTLSKSVSLTGVNSDTTIIHAVAGQRVLTVTGATITNSVVISGLTFMAGLADKGGGILIEQQARPIIRNLLLYNNRADQGGGLYSYGPVSMIDTRVISNGAIHGGGGAYAGMTATLTGGEFIANDSWADGGGAYLVQAAIITGTQFRNNHGSNGGGLFADLNTYPGPWVLTNTEFLGNAAQAGGGAALFGTSQITVQIDGGRFENNTSSTYGGGLLGDRVRLSGTRFISNSAVSSGGGALVYDASVTDSLFERNAISTGDGGGLMAHNLLLRHTTFVSNTASGNGGGLFASEAVTLTNVDFISNMATDSGGGVFVANAASLSDTFFDHNRCAAESAAEVADWPLASQVP